MKLLSNSPVNLQRNACLYRPVRISVSWESCVKCAEGEVRLRFSWLALVRVNISYPSWLFCSRNKNSGKHSSGYLIMSDCVYNFTTSLCTTNTFIFQFSFSKLHNWIVWSSTDRSSKLWNDTIIGIRITICYMIRKRTNQKLYLVFELVFVF